MSIRPLPSFPDANSKDGRQSWGAACSEVQPYLLLWFVAAEDLGCACLDAQRACQEPRSAWRQLIGSDRILFVDVTSLSL